VPKPTAGVAEALLGIPVALLIAGSWIMPRRLPDLPRFTASPEFAALHDEAVHWSRTQFGFLEQATPWLQVTGRSTQDWCRVELKTRPDLTIPALSVRCDRRDVAVYGADGPVTRRFAALGPLLEIEDAVPPDGLTQRPVVYVGWASRDQPADPLFTLDGRVRLPSQPGAGQPGGGQAGVEQAGPRASRFLYPVESGPADIDELAAAALARHEHVVVIAMRRCYYLNPDVRHYPLPRRGHPRQALFVNNTPPW
jgi:hypothetical protein